MATTPTSGYAWPMPTVGASTNVWGTELNTLIDDHIEVKVAAVETTANAALPKAGGAMTGRVDVFSSTLKRIDKGSISGAVTLDLSTGNVFTATVTGNVTSLDIVNAPSGTWGTFFCLILTNGGAFTVTWNSRFKWPGGTAPTLTASGKDILAFLTSDNGTTVNGVLSQADSR